MPLARNLSKGLSDIPGLFQAFRTRCYSQQTVSVPSSATSSTPGAQLAQLSHPYFVPRNSRGSLPVYSDIRNGGTRYLVLVKNVHGNINDLRDDLTKSLFEAGSQEASRLKMSTHRNDTLILSGGRWKHKVMDWLRLKGF